MRFDEAIVANVIRSSIHGLLALFNEAEFAQLEAPVKTVLGLLIEKKFLDAFHLPCKKGKHSHPPGMILDTMIEGVHCDIKCTIGNNWMVPPENVGHWCLLFQIDVPHRLFSMGWFKAEEGHLHVGHNRDKKRGISKVGKQTIRWELESCAF